MKIMAQLILFTWVGCVFGAALFPGLVPPAKLNARAYVHAGKAYVMRGDINTAIELYETALEKMLISGYPSRQRTGNATILTSLCTLYLTKKEYGNAYLACTLIKSKGLRLCSMARVYAAIGEKQKAVELLRQGAACGLPKRFHQDFKDFYERMI